MGSASVQGKIPEQGYEDTSVLALGYTVSALLIDHGFQVFFLFPFYPVHENPGTK